jgi:hypothetical protein
MYKWIQPRICYGGLDLPREGSFEVCTACNVGMQLINGTCHFCKPNEYSDGSAECKACPGSTAPEIAIVYKHWNNLPANANITTRCLSLHDAGWSTILDCSIVAAYFSDVNVLKRAIRDDTQLKRLRLRKY